MTINSPTLAHRMRNAIRAFRRTPTLPDHGWSYFDHMVAVYHTLDKRDKRADEVIEKGHERPYGLTWGDIFLLENVILSLQPDDTLRRNQWIVRERFREIAGESIYNRYIESDIPKDADTPKQVELVRADLSRLLDFLHWYYALIPIREAKRTSLTGACILMVTACSIVLGFAVYFLLRYQHEFLAMGACVIFAGTVGGLVSSQRRMQSIPIDGDPLISIFGLENSGYYLLLSPMLGGIFAVVLMLLFVSGILQGTVFPEFHKIGSDSMLQALPTGSVDYAKLFSWSFLAGFAERLVPDNLDRLAMKLSTTNPPPPSPSPAPAIQNAQHQGEADHKAANGQTKETPPPGDEGEEPPPDQQRGAAPVGRG